MTPDPPKNVPLFTVIVESVFVLSHIPLYCLFGDGVIDATVQLFARSDAYFDVYLAEILTPDSYQLFT